MMIHNPKPRIGIFTRPIDKGTSGSGHHLHEMVRTMLQINREKELFEFFFVHYVKTDRDIYHLAKEVFIPRNPLSAAAVLRKYNFDLLHHSPLTIFSPLAGLRVKRVATIHSAEPNIIPQYYTMIEQAHARFIKPVYARKMDHIFTVSETSKRYYIENWHIPAERISVCYNAVDSVYRKLDGPLPVLDKFSLTGRYIYHISKYSLRKNPSCLLRAFAELSAKSGMHDLQLVISGSGWDNGTVMSLLDTLDLHNKVVFTGFTDESEVVQLFNGASVFLFPSRAEGYGMPNIEAMSCGCPVVTTRAFAIPEIVGEAALLVDDPDDYNTFSKHAGRILNDINLRESMIRKGFEQVKRYSWTKSATTVLETYEKLLTQNP